MSRETKGKEVAEVLSDFVNSAFQNERKQFVETIVRDHRALQEEVFKLFLETCEAWSEMYKEGRYDPRNEFTVKTAYKIVEMLKEG